MRIKLPYTGKRFRWIKWDGYRAWWVIGSTRLVYDQVYDIASTQRHFD